jgi:hypothetical protein
MDLNLVVLCWRLASPGILGGRQLAVAEGKARPER